MNATINHDIKLPKASTPLDILQSALNALNDGKISQVVDAFDDHFTFNDQALGLKFTDKGRLSEFFEKLREFFPDTVLKLSSTFECGGRVIAEWKITATETVPYGSRPFRFPISLAGASIVEIKNGRITRWSDYYDKSTSRRISLAAFFTEWTEY